MIGQNIKRMRKLKGWSQQQLARMMGYKSKSTINKIEKNINDVGQKNLMKFAEVFKCDPADLLIESFATSEEFELAWHRSGGGHHPLNLTETECELVLAYRCADSITKRNIMRILDIKIKEKREIDGSNSSKGA